MLLIMVCIRIYYQHNPGRLQTCPVNLHYLLHVADSIAFIGPVWCYWAYPMERFCSFIGASVKSRRFPYANIARRIRDTAQLRVAHLLYGLKDTRPSRDRTDQDEVNLKNADILPDCEIDHYLL
jgi:hypothetical protein